MAKDVEKCLEIHSSFDLDICLSQKVYFLSIVMSPISSKYGFSLDIIISNGHLTWFKITGFWYLIKHLITVYWWCKRTGRRQRARETSNQRDIKPSIAEGDTFRIIQEEGLGNTRYKWNHQMCLSVGLASLKNSKLELWCYGWARELKFHFTGMVNLKKFFDLGAGRPMS